MTESKKSQFELVVELAKALAWPLLVAIVLASFWNPLQKVAELLPSLIGRSDSISIAGLSLKLSPTLKNKATPDVELALSRVSRASIERILALGDSTSWDTNSIAYGKEQSKELIDAGLVAEVPAADLQARNKAHGRTDGYMIRTTELGKRTQAFLRAVIAEVVQEIATGAASAPR